MAKIERQSLATSTYNQELIIYIDLIGFKNFILKSRKKEINTIIALTKNFQEQVSEGYKNNYNGYSPAFNFFSDSIVISLPLDLHPDVYLTDISTNPEKILKSNYNIGRFQLLFAGIIHANHIQLQALKHGLLSRGCINIGEVYHNQNTWFGPGFIESYQYESTIAKYPRVILSKTAQKYFYNELKYANNLLLVDSDGFYFSNYLGWVHTVIDNEYVLALKKIRKLIVMNLKNQNIVETQKWQWLAVYYNKTIEITKKHNDNKKIGDKIDLEGVRFFV